MSVTIDGTSGVVTPALTSVNTNTTTLASTTEVFTNPPVNAMNPCFSAWQNVAVSSTTTPMPFQIKSGSSQAFDNTNAFNNTASPIGNTLAYSFNPLVAGYYQINAAIEFSSAAYQINITILVNGVAIRYGNQPAPGTRSTVSAIVYLDGSGVGANSNIQIAGYSATTQNTATAGAIFNTYFQAALISRTA